MKVEDIISDYDLKPHPEGGFFKEIYRSAGVISEGVISGAAIAKNSGSDKFPNWRNFSTSIYYLLSKGAVSKFHMIQSDEIFHFYSGGPLVIVQINSHGVLEKHRLGADINSGQLFQYIVKAGNWFGAYPELEYSLVGCTVSPGFDFRDFKIADRSELLKLHPKHEDIIKKLT
ncbi:MAG: cupin domain-containing protein [Proteobacteria bacterium]|nr:cupin domain-containing protein [Pseudomonadota bacterium]